MSGPAHFVWFILTLMTGLIALPLWIICALCCGSSKRNKMQKLQEENNQLLKKIQQQNMYRGYRD